LTVSPRPYRVNQANNVPIKAKTGLLAIVPEK
jgi:hypothetical protein